MVKKIVNKVFKYNLAYIYGFLPMYGCKASKVFIDNG